MFALLFGLTLAQHAENNICVSNYVENDPTSGCYVQSGEWEPGKDVSCKMENKACLPVECSATGLKAHFRTDLFDKKLEQEFYLDLMQGRLRIKHKDRELKRFETCGYSFAAIDQRLFLVIDWNYGECDFDVSLVENNSTDCAESIHYSVTLHAEYIDSVDRIEFAVELEFQKI